MNRPRRLRTKGNRKLTRDYLNKVTVNYFGCSWDEWENAFEHRRKESINLTDRSPKNDEQ